MSNQNPQSLRIFTIIAQIEQLLESAPKPKLGAGGRRLIDVEEVFDLLGDLKVTIPEDIRRANSVLLEADTLLGDANQEAADMLERAQQEADTLREQALSELAQTRQAAQEEFEARVSEDSVHLEVQRRCELLQKHAEHNANAVFSNAKDYADAILQDLQRYLMEYHHIVGKNRDELGVSASVQQPAIAPSQPARQQQVPQPVQPQRQRAQAQASDKTPSRAAQREEYEEEAPRRKRGGFFRKSDQDFLSEEETAAFGADDEQEVVNTVAPRRSGIRRGRDLDLDLDE